MELTEQELWRIQHLDKDEAHRIIEFVIGKFGVQFVMQTAADSFKEIVENEDNIYTDVDIARADGHIRLLESLADGYFDNGEGELLDERIGGEGNE